MKVEIKTSAKNVEMANHLLALAIDSFKKHPENYKRFGLNKNNIKSADQFRKALINGFTNSLESTKALTK